MGKYRKGGERRERGTVTERRRGKDGVDRRGHRDPYFRREGSIWIFVYRDPEFLVTPILMGLV